MGEKYYSGKINSSTAINVPFFHVYKLNKILPISEYLLEIIFMILAHYIIFFMHIGITTYAN